MCLTYARQRESHLVHFDLVYEGHTHAVGQHHVGGDDVDDGTVRQGTGSKTEGFYNAHNNKKVRRFPVETNLKAGLSKTLVAPVQLISNF